MSFIRPLAALGLTVLVTACGPAAIPSGINDPYEAQNRRVHQENIAVDRAFLKPSSSAYGGIPAPVRHGVAHFADTVDTPRMVVNSLLQGRPDDAIHSTLRFVVNATIGVAGLLDPATEIGLERRDTDFGETLHVWGVPEGDYQELPVIGPSTERDTLGTVVDFALNPLGYVLPSPEKYATTVAGGLSKLGDRYTYGSTVDSILYESADSYAQARTLYLQNRRYELRRFGAGADDEYLDPYADTAGTGAPTDTYASDPGYFDPYEDTLQ